MKDFAGKTAFVTGGASGIGFGMAQAFARRGMKIMLADIEEQPLAEAVETLRGQGFNADADGVVVDVANLEAVKAAAARTQETFGGVHILCNNAGVGGGGAFGEMSPEAWHWTIDVNLHGVFNGLTAFVPMMKAQGEGGHIVNTASMAGIIGGGGGAYAASKFAVVGMSTSLRDELAPFGIGVSVLCPGLVATNILQAARNFHGDAAKLAAGAPRDAAAVKRFAAFQEALRTGLPPAVLGERVAECIEQNVFYAITHPSWWPLVQQRQAEVKAGFDSANASRALEGHVRDELAVLAQMAAAGAPEEAS